MRAVPALMLAAGLMGCAPEPPSRWDYYQADLFLAGYLRQDRAPEDVSYSNADLVRAFRLIMFRSEFALEDGVYVPRLEARPLERRMQSSVTYRMRGSGVTADDRANLAQIVRLMTEATGLDIRPVTENADITVSIVTAQERLQIAALLEERRPGNPLSPELENDFNGSVCIAVPLDQQDGSDPSYVIFIPDEVSDLLRRACIEEEFAQAFGPGADSDTARPSIFNDDQEFALFTEHDAWLMRILYDPRLKAGMTEDEAIPLVRRIVAELRPGQ